MIFYSETISRQVELQEGKEPSPEKHIITRYYTEFNPDPLTVLDRLFVDKNDGLPPIFYEIEELSSINYKLPFLAGIKPLSIVIEQGMWGDRLDWTVSWEQVDHIQDPIIIAGLTLYDWTSTTLEGQEAAEYLFGHKIFDTNSNIAGASTILRTKKPIYKYSGTVLGQIDYTTLRDNIKQNENIVDFNFSYSKTQNITQVDIVIESPLENDDD